MIFVKNKAQDECFKKISPLEGRYLCFLSQVDLLMTTRPPDWTNFWRRFGHVDLFWIAKYIFVAFTVIFICLNKNATTQRSHYYYCVCIDSASKLPI